MAQADTKIATSASPPPQKRSSGRSGSTRVLPTLVKIIGLGTAIGLAAALTPVLIGQSRWLFLCAIWAIVIVLVATYSTGRAVPAKYLVPGVMLLVVFVVYPVIGTFQLSFTNYGDGTRTTKEETITQIVGASVVETPDAPRYNLTVGTTGSVTTGPFVFFLVDPVTGVAQLGTEEGLESTDATVTDGFVTEASGYTLLTPKEVNAAADILEDFIVPTDNGAIRQLGIKQAFEGETTLVYDEATDTITDTVSGTVYSVEQQGDKEFFVSPSGEKLSDQSWKSNVGFANYEEVLTNPQIRNDFISIFIWTFAFALLSVGTTFFFGLLLAVMLNDPRLKGQRVLRSVLLIPFAIPGFISLLVWSGFFNTDYGLINELTGLNINWLGTTFWARCALILTNLWMGFPYMFLVCTGALQSIPGDLRESASIDGASGFYGFRKITFPLLLVSVAPLLVASFAFNFNNFNAIALLTEGGPFSPENPTAGGTDILISYTMRLAFGSGGAQLGLAAAVSVLLFIITGVIAAMQFRLTRRFEDVN